MSIETETVKVIKIDSNKDKDNNKNKNKKPLRRPTYKNKPYNFPKYKSAGILPYHHNGEEYIYLLAHEIDGNFCGGFGGMMEKSDRNNTWTNACRELGEELYGYKGEELKKFINITKNQAKHERINCPHQQKRHYEYLCQWNKIAPKTTPEEILEQFQPNIEIKGVHWVRANDLWNAMERTDPKRIYGKNAKEVWIPTYNDNKLKKIRLRPCFLDGCYYLYQKKRHLPHVTEKDNFPTK